MERFNITKTLGDGAFGSVVKAENLKTGEVVAIKIMKKKFSSWEECISLREIKSLRKFNHPNIIKLKEVVKVKDSLNLVFEFLDKDLLKFYSEYKEKGARITEKDIKVIVGQVFSGLAHMHKHGFFHRDMKPENILMTDLHVKLADFGLAREIRSRPPYTEYVSTRWYRAPEILMKSQNYNSPVDIFAVGCILAELYTLSPLFNGISEIDQMYKICQAMGTPTQSIWPEGFRLASKIGFSFPHFPPGDKSQIFKGIPEDAVQFICDMLKYDSSKRPTANQILNHSYFADTQLDTKTSSTQNQNQDNSSVNTATHKSEVQRKLEEIRNAKKSNADEDNLLSDDSEDEIPKQKKFIPPQKPHPNPPAPSNNLASIDIEDMLEDDNDEALEKELDSKWKKPKVFDRADNVHVLQNEKTSYSFKNNSISTKREISSEKEKPKPRIMQGINGQGLSGIQKQLDEEFPVEEKPYKVAPIAPKMTSKPSFDKKRLFEARVNHFEGSNPYSFNAKFPLRNPEERSQDRRLSREKFQPKPLMSNNNVGGGNLNQNLNNRMLPHLGSNMGSNGNQNFGVGGHTNNGKGFPSLRNENPMGNPMGNGYLGKNNFNSLPPSLRTVNRRDEILEKYSKYKKY